MQLVYANQPLPQTWTKSLFLAGPTPRDADTPSWRAEAIALLRASGYDGVVFIPEDETGKWQHSYIDQVEWEETCLNACDCIVFWIPRDLATMPAFTTNIELGVWIDSGKAIVGFPETAPKTKYIAYYANKLKVPSARSLDAALKLAMEFLGVGTLRSGGARKIPLFIYNTKHFQDWYRQHTSIGNRLDDARVLWNFRVGNQRKFPLFWTIHVNVFVSAENRNKSNEIIISRTDISSVLAYKKGTTLGNTKICLVKEFRSPASTPDGFIWELPGGSSPKKDQDPFEVASEEFAEETGLTIAKSRFSIAPVTSRQLAGTVSTHKSHLFIVELTDNDVSYLESQKGIIHGNHISDSEQTYVEMVEVSQILNPIDSKGESPFCDWATIGMILSVLANV